MTISSSDIAFTPSVKHVQTAKGSREIYARVEQGTGWRTAVTADLVAFLAEQDMFYLGSSSASGQPYIQYRGGPPGFLRVTGEHTLAFADFGGNQQYITLGNLAENPQAFIFLMDYVQRRRIKLWGTAKVIEDDEALLQRLTEPTYPGIPERAIVFTIKTWDVNCPQHIHPRLRLDSVNDMIQHQQEQIEELRVQLAAGGRSSSHGE